MPFIAQPQRADVTATCGRRGGALGVTLEEADLVWERWRGAGFLGPPLAVAGQRLVVDGGKGSPAAAERYLNPLLRYPALPRDRELGKGREADY